MEALKVFKIALTPYFIHKIWGFYTKQLTGNHLFKTGLQK